MKNNICTTKEQSQKLIELGLDVNTADMYWGLNNQNHPPVIGKYCAEYGGMQLPAWSLSALLDILPYPTLAQHANGLWSLTAWVDTVEPYSVGGYDNKIDACVAMIFKLKERNLL